MDHDIPQSVNDWIATVGARVGRAELEAFVKRTPAEQFSQLVMGTRTPGSGYCIQNENGKSLGNDVTSLLDQQAGQYAGTARTG